MFTNSITLFNFDEENNKYYKTLFKNVELQSTYQANFTVDSTIDSDVSLLIVNYYLNGVEKQPVYVNKTFRTPKVWNNIEGKENYFTFECGRDFFAKGDYTLLNITSYEQFKHSHDDVFMIHQVKDFEDDLKHWEILGY